MSKKDEEIKKLERYAQGLGIKVSWLQHKKGLPGAEWHSDGSQINIYIWPRKSKTQIILDFVHELAHHMSWVYSGRKTDFKTDQALELDENRKPGDPPIPKEQRKIIYLAEKNDAKYRKKIVKELGLSVSPALLKIDIKLDIWIYKKYYLTGDAPSYKDIKKKLRELKAKYVNKG